MAKIKKAFAKTLKELRFKRKLTQEELGLDSRLGQNFVSELERAQKVPSIVTLIKLSNALAVKPSEFMAEIEKKLKSR